MVKLRKLTGHHLRQTGWTRISSYIVLDVDDEAAPNDIPRDEAQNLAQHGPNMEVAAVNFQAGMSRKRPASTEAHDSDSAFVRITPFLAHRLVTWIRTMNIVWCSGSLSVNGTSPKNLDVNCSRGLV
ncbi:hypothetical protein Hanom_Chr01g00020201 [Helianthus anomalus]